MAPACPAGKEEMIVEAHEDRIQSLEQTTQRLIGQSTEALIKIDFLSKQVSETHESILERIESSFSKIGVDIDGNTKKITDIDERVETVEEQHQQEAATKASYKKFISPLVIAGATVLVTKYAEQFWTWLSR